MTVAYLTPLSLSSSFFVPFSRSKKWSACTRENASRRCVLYIFCLFQRRNTSTWKQLFESSFSDFVCRWNLGNVNLEFFKNNLRSKRNLGSRVYQGFSRANSFTFVRVEHGQGWALLRSLSLSLSLSFADCKLLFSFFPVSFFFFLSFSVPLYERIICTPCHWRVGCFRVLAITLVVLEQNDVSYLAFGLNLVENQIEVNEAPKA